MHPGFHAAVRPRHPALIMAGSGDTLTYQQLDDRSSALARQMKADGLVSGDVVAIFLENRPEYLEVAWAALRAGLYVTTVPWHLTAREASHIVRDSGARVLVVSRTTLPVAKEIVETTPDVLRRISVDGEDHDHADYRSVLQGSPDGPLEDGPLGDFMLYSSGTTGAPKGVQQPLSGRLVSEGNDVLVPALPSIYGMTEESVYLSPAPLYHSAPLQFSTSVQAIGATVVVLERFDAEECLAAMQRYRVTHAQFVPTMFVRMLKLPEETRLRYDLSSLQCAVHAAAPCPVDVKRRMIDWWGPIILEYYSGTEGVGVTYIDSKEWLEHPGSVGRPVGAPLHVCDESGEELPPGGEGLIYFETVPGRRRFEYHNDPKKTRSSAHPSFPEWFTLGDIGRVDEDGYLYLTDRKAFMIVSGGVNIYPQEIEDVLIVHPKVADVAVFGVPDDDFGEQVKAVVQLADPDEAGPQVEAELLTYCRERLSKVKCPRSIDFDAALPRLDNGKLYKRVLRDRYWQGRETRIGS